MRYKIRRSVFETNSSSVHSIQILNTTRQPSELKVNSRDKMIHVECGQFGKEYCLYTTQYEKLQYLVTLLAYSSGAYWDLDTEPLDRCYEFEMLNNYIKEYCNCKGIKVTRLNKAEIDHQSQPESGWIDFINMYDKDKVLDFIFSDSYALRTDSD